MGTFGVATLEAPVKHDRARRFDCGKYGKLTALQIARQAGITREGVWQRVRNGVTGTALCDPRHEALRRVRVRCSNSVVRVAVKLARAFPDGVPTVAQIRKAHPMCSRNAMRWRQAFADARA